MSEPTFRASPSPPASAGYKEDPASERRTLRDYLIMLRERLWIALPLALLISVGYGYYRARETPLYSATATMQFEKPERVVLNQEVVDPSVTNEIDLNTYLRILESARLRTKVVSSFTPEESRILLRPFVAESGSGASPPPLSGALGTVAVQSIRNSYLMSISVSHQDAEAAALVANRYVDQFMLDLVERVGGRNEYAVEYLKTRAEQLRKESEAAQQRLQDYMKQHNLVSLDNSVNIVTERLKSVNTALQAARLERLNMEQLFSQVTAFAEQKQNLLEISYVANHGTLPVLRTQLDELQRTESALKERYFERHPRLIEISNQVRIARDQVDRAVDLAIKDLQSTLEKLRAQEQSLEREYKANEQEQLKLRDLAVDFQTLENQAAVAGTNYSQILNRLTETTTSSSLERFPVRPLDRAVAPGGPYTPNLRQIARVSAGLFVFVFVGVALTLGYIDDRVKSAWDIETFIGTTLLGIVPDLSRVKDEEKYTLVLDNKQELGAEAFLSVYSSVKIHSKLDFPKSILVTSTIPGEGKTLISCNLAGSFARHGKRTLLIDCDLRRPMLHRHFKNPNTSGLLPWFQGGASFDSNLALHPQLGITPVGENLWLLCSGGRSKSPTELLESPVFGRLLDRLKTEFDLVVVDSPPLGAVTDAMLIAEKTDEIVYVCRFNRAHRKHIRLFIKALRDGKNDILGVVLNGMSPRRIEYYSNYRYYRSYRKYYGTQT